MIPYGHQHIDVEEINAVVEVLHSGWLTQGPMVPAFEQAVSDYCGADNAVAVSNGTAALHLACIALGLGHGDSLWTSPNTFVASANCARYCGADVDFIDIDPLTRNLSLSALSTKLKQAKNNNCLPKVVVPVHFAGLPCDMEGIAKLAKEYGFYVIEDAAHAMGSRYGDVIVGSCRHSDMTVFSYHPVKTMTSAEGGMITCNDRGLAQRLRELRSHGISKEQESLQNTSHGPWYYEQQRLGFNYRMNDIQAAMGVVQLKRLAGFIGKRRQLVSRYNDAFEDLPLKFVREADSDCAAWHLYVIELPSASSRQEIYDTLIAKGIGVNVHYIPVHIQPYYQQQGFNEGDFPKAEHYYKGALTLPLYPDLTEFEQDFVIASLRECLQ